MRKLKSSLIVGAIGLMTAGTWAIAADISVDLANPLSCMNAVDTYEMQINALAAKKLPRVIEDLYTIAKARDQFTLGLDDLQFHRPTWYINSKGEFVSIDYGSLREIWQEYLKVTEGSPAMEYSLMPFFEGQENLGETAKLKRAIAQWLKTFMIESPKKRR